MLVVKTTNANNCKIILLHC